MRIALVSEHADPLAPPGGEDAGGQNVHVASLATGLVQLGHDVVVHTRRDRIDAPGRVRAPAGYVVDRVPVGPPVAVPKDALLPFMDDFGDHLRRRWATDPADVVHAHFWMSGLAALRATVGTRTPVVQTFHALGSVKRREQGVADPSPIQRIRIEQRLCREVSRVIATCTDEVRELHALGLPRGRATVIPCGVDVHRFRPLPALPGPVDGRRPRLLVVGRLVERKGIATVLEALTRLPGVDLLVVGGPRADQISTDADVARLRGLASRLGVEDRVCFLGRVEQEDLPHTIAACDVVVSVPWYEPFGIVPLEAMACARPIVGSAVGGLLDTIVPGHTGELVPRRDPGALAETLRTLLSDPRRRAEYGARGRAWTVEEFDWRTVAERTERVYAELCRPSAVVDTAGLGPAAASHGAALR